MVRSVAQISTFPYAEDFDATVSPSLPEGWTSSTNKSSAGDFVTTTSLAHSSPNALLSSDSKVSQWVQTPVFDFTYRKPEKFSFWERRSSTHNSSLLLEASLDSGATYSIVIGDTLKNPGTTSYVYREFLLPRALDGKQSVRFRFRVVGDGTGSTGTLRIDDVSITVLAATDLGISRMAIDPTQPMAGDAARLRALIQNHGSTVVAGASIEFFIDLNGDSIGTAVERFASSSIPSLAPGDSTWVEASIDTVPGGLLRCIATVVAENDGNSLNNRGLLDLFVRVPPEAFVINELQYAPRGGEPEWIELFNRSPFSVNLQDFGIANHTNARYILMRTPLFVPHGSFVVVTKDSSVLTYHANIASPLVIVRAMPFYFLSNSGDVVKLSDGSIQTIDSIAYLPSWGGGNGVSLERIDTERPSTDSRNWASSIDSELSTPGRRNSIARLEHDLRIKWIASHPPVDAVIENVGRSPATGFSVSLYNDANRDSVLNESERIEEQSVAQTLLPNDSLHVRFQWIPQSGVTSVAVKISYPLDERTSNNVGWQDIVAGFQEASVVVNEIMYEPLTGESEYVEFYNRGDSPVDLYRWAISDGASSRATIAGSHVLLAPGGFAVVASDSSIFQFFPELSRSNSLIFIIKTLSLNNEGDRIILTDPAGRVIDSVHYSPTWHNPAVSDRRGVSLERIHPSLSSSDSRAWSSCADRRGGTPGARNSIFTSFQPTDLKLTFTPNPFSPDADGFEDFTVIQYDLPYRVARIRIRIFDVLGRLVRTLANNEPSGARGEIVWDGRDDEGQRVRIGRYIVLLEAVDESGNLVDASKAVVVVAGKMR